MKPRAVVVTGLGFVTPIGHDRRTVIDALWHLRHGLQPVDWFPDCPVKLAGTISDFVLDDFQPALWRWPGRDKTPREILRSSPPHVIYALSAIDQALQESRLEKKDLADGTTGLFCASAGSPRFLAHYMPQVAESCGARIPPWSVVMSIAGSLNLNLAPHFGIRGAVAGFVSACAASAHALGYACDEIVLGRQDRMIVVGAEEPTWESLLPFDGLRTLSRQSDPALASRPFDAGRDGFVGAGGAVALILESADSAQLRGAAPQCEILGWGQSADGYRVAQTEPEGHGLEAAIQRAFNATGISAGEIDYVHAHATGTVVGDLAEARALGRVFREKMPLVSSTKALTGHTLSMSGALGAAVGTLALREGFIPGQAHLKHLDPACAHLRIPPMSLSQRPSVVLCNSSGFGGSNVALLLRAI